MPDGRTGVYAVYKACERFGILPPGLKGSWNENDLEGQSMLLAYSQIREDEDAKLEGNRLSATIGSRAIR